MADRGPISTCLEKHGSNATLGFHECMCNFDYSYARNKVKVLKMKHCHEAAEMYKIEGFYSYVIIIAAVLFGVIAIIAMFCSCKWYCKTKRNPCNCFCNFSCCSRKRNRRAQEADNDSINAFEPHETGHTWTPVSLPPQREGEMYPTSLTDETQNPGSCMSFCLSDPVQDCCEFFDCDILWRKKSVYTIPIFGRKKQQQYFQRRPTRPAPAPPPPPKAVVLPQLKQLEIPIDDTECEPVPEAPPSPEPVRAIPSKALYVDPFSFLQKPFLKVVSEKDYDEKNDKQEALYSRLRNMVSKVKKSVSLASINKLGVSGNPNGVSDCPSGSASSNRKLKTASLASLHNLGEIDLDASYGSKRSLSLASLHMLQQEALDGDPRSRFSVVSTATDDIPPCARKDEYIDLEEMSKRVEAKMRAAQLNANATVPAYGMNKAPVSATACTSNAPTTYTPNFIPASAFMPTASTFYPYQPEVAEYQYRSHRSEATSETPYIGQYYPPVPASQGKPAVPARTLVGAPIYSVSPTATLNRSKPVIPPRPSNIDSGSNSSRHSTSSSSRSSTITRSPRIVKPSGPPPPPPPPGNKPPIESSI